MEYEACNHNEAFAVMTRRVLSNGVVTVWLQCECGDGIRAIKKDGIDVASLPEFNESRVGSRWREHCERAKAAIEEGQSEFFRAYSEYLGTDHWRQVRRIVLNRDTVCQVCFRNKSEQAHHVSYESYKRFGISFAVECVGVCYACHFGKLHNDRSPNV